jgi:hypothetical protein
MTVGDYEDFHIGAQAEESRRVAAILESGGVRTRERVVREIGILEYVIEVHREDLDRAQDIFWKDLGPTRSFTSDGT